MKYLEEHRSREIEFYMDVERSFAVEVQKAGVLP